MAIKTLQMARALPSCVKCCACFRQMFDACPINKEFCEIASYSFVSIVNIADGIIKGDFNLSKELAPVPFGCTLCGFCATQCRSALFHTIWDSPADFITSIRAIFVEAGEVPAKVSSVFNNLATFGNAWRLPSTMRIKWERECEFSVPDFTSEHNEFLLFVGDAALIEETKSTVVSIAKLLQRARVDFGTLKEREFDSGETARELGEYGLFEVLAEKNIKSFKEYGVKKLIVISPHDYHVFSVHYPRLGFKFEKVYHYTELLNDLLKDGRIRPTKETSKTTIAYHDPCFLGRYHGIFEPPREIIRAIPGNRFVEMKQNRNFAFCCGGGGGRMWYDIPEETYRRRISEIRVAHAKESGADIIATACPYCKSNILSACFGEPLVKDVAELLLEAT